MDKVIEIINYQIFGVALWIYGASLGAIVFGFIAKKIVAAIFNHLGRLTEKTKLPFDDIVIDSISKPAQWAVMLGGIFVAVLILPLPKEPVDIDKFVKAALVATAGILIIWVGIRLVDGIADWAAKKAEKTDTKLDDQLVPIIRRALKVFLVLIGGILVLQNLGYSVVSLLTGLGIGGLAFALAAKDALANLFGSVVVFMDKPFQIGDWIEVGDIEGTVEEVGLRTTRVRTFANSLITVPNAIFTSSKVNNWSRMQKRRIKMTVGVTYSTSPEKMEELVTGIRKLIQEDESILDDFYLVNFDGFGASSLDVFIYCFTRTTVWAEFLEVKQGLMLEIMRLVKELGLDFAYPTQSIHVESFPGQPRAMTSQRPM